MQRRPPFAVLGLHSSVVEEGEEIAPLGCDGFRDSRVAASERNATQGDRMDPLQSTTPQPLFLALRPRQSATGRSSPSAALGIHIMAFCSCKTTGQMRATPANWHSSAPPPQEPETETEVPYVGAVLITVLVSARPAVWLADLCLPFSTRIPDRGHRSLSDHRYLLLADRYVRSSVYERTHAHAVRGFHK